MKRKPQEHGFTLLEVMMVLVVALLIMAGVFGLVSQVMGDTKVKNAQENLATLRIGVTNIYSGEHNYSGLNNQVARNAGIKKKKMYNSASGTDEITNEWNGGVTVAEDSSDPKFFTITYSNIPQDACVKLATLTGYDNIAVDGTDVDGVTAASTACTDGASIVFSSR